MRKIDLTIQRLAALNLGCEHRCPCRNEFARELTNEQHRIITKIAEQRARELTRKTAGEIPKNSDPNNPVSQLLETVGISGDLSRKLRNTLRPNQEELLVSMTMHRTGWMTDKINRLVTPYLDS